MTKAFLDLLTQEVVESRLHHSGGNLWHRIIRYDNDRILSIHFAEAVIEVSHNTHVNIEKYLDSDFGNEYNLPNYQKRCVGLDAILTNLLGA